MAICLATLASAFPWWRTVSPVTAGPLAGIHAGIAWAKAHRPGAPFVISTATDTPFLPTDLVSRFRAESRELGEMLIVARPAVKIRGRTVDPFFNINRPEDLAAAEALLR
jgi:molybdopterin-guanine dinucleotide biosynthesis protein A